MLHRVRQAPRNALLVLLLLSLLLVAGVAGCRNAPQAEALVETSAVAETHTVVPVVTVVTAPSATPPPTATSTAVPSPTAEPTMTPTPETLPYIVVIDPGHGGKDLGARHFDENGRMVYHESQVNLELGLLVRDELELRGFQVVMTREGDYEVNADDADTDGDGILNYTLDESHARVDLANAAGADLLLSLHQNAFEYPDGRRGLDIGGIQTFYCVDRPFGDENHRFAALIHEALIEAYHSLDYDILDRGVHDDLYLSSPSRPRHLIVLGPLSDRIVRSSQMPGALSEPLFITHEIEGQLARDPEVLARLAVAYADAVQGFFEDQDPRE